MNSERQNQQDRQQADGPNEATMRTGMAPDVNVGEKPEEGQLAANPSMRHEDLASPDALPSEKKEPSAIPGAEETGDIGSAQAGAGFAGGTKGAGTSSESRKGNPDNYGRDQAGAGMATGPVDGGQG